MSSSAEIDVRTNHPEEVDRIRELRCFDLEWAGDDTTSRLFDVPLSSNNGRQLSVVACSFAS